MSLASTVLVTAAVAPGAASAEDPGAAPVSSLLTQAAKLRPRSGKARRAAVSKRKAKAARSEPPSVASKTEDLGALLDAVAAGELDDSHVTTVLDRWVAAQGGEECLSPEVVGLAIRAYSLAGKHHLAASVFRAFESEQLHASAYAALARSCLTTGDADTGIALISRLEQADIAMSPRVYEVLVRAALLSGAPDQAAAVLETLLSLLPQPSLRVLSGATLRALTEALLDKLDVDEAVRYLSAMDERTLRTPATRGIIVRLASLSAGTRSVAGARCALRAARVLSGEAAAGLLCSHDDDAWAREAAAAADDEDVRIAREGGVVLPPELPVVSRRDAVRDAEALAASRRTPPSSSPVKLAGPTQESADTASACWRIAAMVSSTAVGGGDAALADEAAAWAETLASPPTAAVNELATALQTPGSGLRLPLRHQRSGQPLVGLGTAGKSVSDGRRFASHVVAGSVRLQLVENRMFARAMAGDGRAVLDLVGEAALEEAAADAVEQRRIVHAAERQASSVGRKGKDATKSMRSIVPASSLRRILAWDTLREAAALLAGQGAAKAFPAMPASDGLPIPPAKAQGTAMAMQANTMTEHVVGMLQSGALKAERGVACTEDGYSVHGMARVLQLLCHVSELTVRLSDVNHLIIQLLEGSIPDEVRAASHRDAKRSMVAVQLSQALVQAAALRDAVAPQSLAAALDDASGEPAEAASAAGAELRSGGLSARTSAAEQTAGSPAAATQSMELLEGDPLLAILDDSGRPSARLATRVALARPRAALDSVRAVARGLGPEDRRSRPLEVAIAAAEAAEAEAGDDDLHEVASSFPGAEAVADASGAAVAALSSPRSFVTRGHTLMLSGINDLHRAGLLIGPRAREFVVAFYSRIGLIDSAFAIAASMSPDKDILVPGSPAWLWHGLPLAAAMHLLRACSLRNDAQSGAAAFALVKESARAEGEDIPPEAFRLLDRLS